MTVIPADTRAPRRARLRLGGVAVVDQILFAGASFSINILLARWLPPVQYGAFALAFFVFLLLGALHTAVLTEPMLVFGASIYGTRMRAYLGRHITLHIAVSLIAAAALSIVAGVLALLGSEAWASMLALAVASPFVLLLWLLRRAFYATLTPSWAAAGDGLYFVATLTGIYLLHESGHLTPVRALLVMGMAAGLACVVMLAVLRPTPRDNQIPWRDLLARHWDYGRWSALAQALFWASGQVLLVLVPLVLGLGALATLAAAVNLFRPLNPLLQSMQTVLLPSTASAVSSGAGLAELRRRLRTYVVLAGGGVFVYGMLLTLFARPVLHLIYHGRYDDHRSIVFLFAISYTISTGVQMQTVLLKATGNVRYVPLLWAVSAGLVLIFAIPAMKIAGLEGGLCVFIVSYLTAGLLARRRARSLALPES